MDFFGENRRDDRDIHASDYSTTKPWKQIRGGTDEPSDYADVRNAVNALAAHPSSERLKYEKGGEREDQGRPNAGITDYLLGLAHLFLEELPPKQRVWFGGIWR